MVDLGRKALHPSACRLRDRTGGVADAVHEPYLAQALPISPTLQEEGRMKTSRTRDRGRCLAVCIGEEDPVEKGEIGTLTDPRGVEVERQSSIQPEIVKAQKCVEGFVKPC